MPSACDTTTKPSPSRDLLAEQQRLISAESLGSDNSRAKYSGALPHRINRLNFWKKMLDPLSRLTPRREATNASVPRRIGVLLQWGIGDAVLALPLLNGLSESFPGASIELIGKPWLRDLFAGERWLAATHELVPPWTKRQAKYRLWNGEWWRYARKLRAMRKVRFDLLIGTRYDPREVLQLGLLNAARTAGVPGAGGKAWITNPIALSPADYYLRYRAEYNALALKEFTGREVPALPWFNVDDAARSAALARLRVVGYRGGPIVCVHNGAGSSIREWRPGSFRKVLDSVGDLAQFVVVIDDGDDPRGPRVELSKSGRCTVWKSGLGDLKALLSAADVLLCCDSGVMHMGAACGCQVVAIFGPGSLEIFAPRGDRHEIVKVDPMPCRPCLDSCIYPRPICMDGITENAVSAALRRSLDAVLSGRAPEPDAAIQRAD
jgi:ADP-heptose:LPS heptosyltransferase